MTTVRAFRWLAACVPSLFLAPTLAAQAVSGSFSPNPAFPGERITFTGTDATGRGFNISSPCAWYRIHAGTPDGPLVPLGLVCPLITIVVPVPPDGSYSIEWDQTTYEPATGRVPVPPGLYWFEIVSHAPVTYAPSTDYFCISIQDPGAPALMQTGPVQLGSPASLEISSPSDPLALYALAASWTSNRPMLSIGVCLSPDSLLNLSLARPNAVFVNGSGLLDGAGRSQGVAVRIPDLPALAYRGFHVQAVIGTSTGLKITNDLSLTIRP